MAESVYVDYGFLEKTERDIKNISDLMKKPGREIDKIKGSDMGVMLLCIRVDKFGDEWDYGIKQLAKYSGAASEALGEVKKGFQEVDKSFAKELQKGKKEKP